MTNGHNLNPGDPAPEGAASPCDCCDGPVSDNGLGDCRNECKKAAEEHGSCDFLWHRVDYVPAKLN